MKKAYGTGTLYLREKYWWAKIHVDGEPICRSTKCQKISDAQKFLNQMMAKKVRGEITGGRPDQILINELLNDVLVSDIADSTRKNWKQVTEANIRPFFGHMRAARLTSDKIQEYREKRLLDGVVDATVNRELTVLRTAFNNGRKRSKVYQCPYFPMKTETNIRTGYLPDAIYVTLRDTITEPEVKLLFVIAFHTGIRKNELLSIKWQQVDLEAGFIDLSPDDLPPEN